MMMNVLIDKAQEILMINSHDNECIYWQGNARDNEFFDGQGFSHDDEFVDR